MHGSVRCGGRPRFALESLPRTTQALTANSSGLQRRESSSSVRWMARRIASDCAGGEERGGKTAHLACQAGYSGCTIASRERCTRGDMCIHILTTPQRDAPTAPTDQCRVCWRAGEARVGPGSLARCSGRPTTCPETFGAGDSGLGERGCSELEKLTSSVTVAPRTGVHQTHGCGPLFHSTPAM